jgi:protein gp37
MTSTALHIEDPISLLLHRKTPRAKIDIKALVSKVINAGFQASWLKNPDGVTQGPQWHLTTCGKGCHCSPGCDNCLHVAITLKAKKDGVPVGPVRFLSENLSIPNRWKSRKNVFVCPQGDLFHKNISDEDILSVFEVIRGFPQHNWILTTKRAKRLRLLRQISGMKNVYIGVSVESQEYLHRADALLCLPEGFRKVLFVCPMLLPVRPSVEVMEELDWIICSPERGGQGRTPRPCPEEWQIDLMYQAKEWGIPFYLDVNYDEKKIFRMHGRHVGVPSALLDSKIK